MKPRIALIQPFIDDGNFVPSLGLLYLGAVLERKGCEVAIFDEHVDKDIEKLIIKWWPHWMAVTAVSCGVIRGKEIVKVVKEATNAFTIFGGPHPTVCAEEVAGWEEVDLVVRGEGESIMEKLVEWWENGGQRENLHNIHGIVWRDENHVIHRNSRLPFLSDSELAHLPLPSYHLLNLNKCWKKLRHGIFYKSRKVLPYMFSRGCSQKCTFCARILGGRVRYFPIDKIMKDLEEIIERFGVEEIFLEDDNFTEDRQRALEILNQIIHRKLPVYLKFANGLRADKMDRELLEKMKEAGCYTLSFGIESGSTRVLEMMKKDLDLERAKENIILAKQIGFKVGANIIVGYPGEKKEDIQMSLDFLLNLDLDSNAMVPLVPLPGTEVWRSVMRKGYLTNLADDWNNYMFKPSRILVRNPEFPPEKLVKFIRKTYFKFYFNPRRFFNTVVHLRPWDIGRIWNYLKGLFC